MTLVLPPSLKRKAGRPRAEYTDLGPKQKARRYAEFETNLMETAGVSPKARFTLLLDFLRSPNGKTLFTAGGFQFFPELEAAATMISNFKTSSSQFPLTSPIKSNLTSVFCQNLRPTVSLKLLDVSKTSVVRAQNKSSAPSFSQSVFWTLRCNPASPSRNFFLA